MDSLKNLSAPPPWVELAAQEAWEKAQKIILARKAISDLSIYTDDPVGFGEKVLGEFYTQDVKKVMRSVRFNRVTIARSSNDVGKSHCAARIAVWFYKVFPDAKVFCTAAPPLENLRRILWGELGGIIRNHEDLFTYDKIKSLKIMRHSLSFIEGVSIPTSGSAEEREARFSGKHAPHLLFIVDEGDAVPEEVYRGIESCMSGDFDRLLIMFNPRAASGPVYYKESRNLANVVELSAFDHPNVTTGKDIIPGAVTRETTIRRINLWTSPSETNDGDCFEVPEFLVGQSAERPDGGQFPPLEAGWRRITEPAFSYMVLGRYPAQSEFSLISQEWIDNARSRYDAYVARFGVKPPDVVLPIIGLDVAEMGADANVACLRYGGWVAPFITWKGMDPDQTALHALELYRTKNAFLCFVDATGVGSGVAPAMARQGRDMVEDGVRAVGVKVANKPSRFIKSEMGEFQTLRDQLWWATREWLRTDQGAMLPPDRALLEELRTPTYEKREANGKIKVMGKDQMRELLRRSPDRADALCLTFTPQARAKIMRLQPD